MISNLSRLPWFSDVFNPSPSPGITLHPNFTTTFSEGRPGVSLPDDPRAHPGAASATSAHLRCPPVRCHRGSGAFLGGLGDG